MSTRNREAGGVGGEVDAEGAGGGGPDGGLGVRIRRMAPADVEAVMAIERSVFSVPWTPATFRSLLRRDGACAWVAEAGAAVVGYAVVWAVLDEAELGNVAVAASHRRRGVATRLVGEAMEWLEARGVREVFLEVRASNESARRLYGSVGFEAVGRRPGYYSRPREDALVLRRRVGPGWSDGSV